LPANAARGGSGQEGIAARARQMSQAAWMSGALAQATYPR
jgi:hypothetical protein